jgi:2-desacetyl-2-hydroxyethyl bacteriochlorophyllide A dehydrogenase
MEFPMREAVLAGFERVEVRERESRLAGVGEVLIDVKACGVCGSDLQPYSDPGELRVGDVLGHEFSGIVTAVGPGAESLKTGDRVVVVPLADCGRCRSCRAGATNTCESLVEARGAGGAFADAVVVPDADRRVRRLPDVVDFAEASLIEPLATAVHAVRVTAPDAFRPAVVLGLGTIGLLVLQLLRARGVSQIIAVDRHPVRQQAARDCGATVVFGGSVEEAERGIREVAGEWAGPFSHGSQAQVVYDCTASPVVLDAALRIVAPGGTVALLGLYQEPPVVDALQLVLKDAVLRGSFAYTLADFDEAVAHAARGDVDLSRLISHRFPLAQVAEAFATQKDKDQALKVIVEP